MCGICGELNFDGARPDVAAVERMTRVLVPRGPDHGGFYSDGPVALGHRRLAIIDLSERGNQPMQDSDLGLVLAFNGTIYNYPELQEELEGKGYHFFSNSDTEVIIKAYHAWGENCVEHLHGMFAFAIWDMKRKELFLARDRLGIKPLYYNQTAGRFRFASNTQALLAGGGVDTSIDATALHHQFTLHAVVPAPRTILQGVRKLAPGTTMKITPNGETKPRRYWTLEAKRPEQERSEEEWIAEVRESLTNAVKKRRSIADVPVGVLLSGGLDSSLLVGLLAESGVKKLKTFSIGFEDVGQEVGSEFEYSDKVVERFGTEHHRYSIANDEVLKRLPEAVAAMAEPMVGQDAVAFYLLGEQVSQDVKVVQSGQGADEVFGGYFWYPKMEKEKGTFVERFGRHYFDRDHDEFLYMVNPKYRGVDHTTILVDSLLAQPGADTFMDRVLRMDTTTLIVDDPVKRVDNMTMAWGLEARVPFLDHQLVELAAQMPTELKLKNGGKHPLKEIARGLIPDEVIDRPKGYFPMPALKYVRGPFLAFMREILLSKECRERGVYNQAYVERLLANPESYLTRIKGSKLWHLALLELWLQINVDGWGVVQE